MLEKKFKIMRKSLFNYSLYSHPEIGNFRVWQTHRRRERRPTSPRAGGGRCSPHRHLLNPDMELRLEHGRRRPANGRSSAPPRRVDHRSLPERVGPCHRTGRAAEARRREATRARFDRPRSSPVQARLGGGFANANAFLSWSRWDAKRVEITVHARQKPICLLSHLIFQRKPNGSHMCARIKFTHIWLTSWVKYQ
jgi:hypothetical protein